MSLRTKILGAILGAVVVAVFLTTWVVNDRIVDGATREAQRQARARGALTSSLYAERAATLVANAEAVALYPAVIAAVAGRNAQPLARWSDDVTTQQQIHVKVFDASGAAISHGHTEARLGPFWDDPGRGDRLEGVDLALAGTSSSGVETSDEVGLALRGYAPVRRDGLTGPVVGAVMLADALDTTLLDRLAGGNGGGVALRVDPFAHNVTERCDAMDDALAAVCQFRAVSPGGRPVAMFTLTVPLLDVESARADAQQSLIVTGGVLLAVGAVVAWLLARSLAAPLAHLTTAARRIARGDYRQPTDPNCVRVLTSDPRSDEIALLAQAFDTMRQRVADATTALRNERDVLDAVLESTAEGILMTTDGGETVVTNGRWAEIVGGHDLSGAADLERVDDGQRFETIARSWLSDPRQISAGDFERTSPQYRRFRCYTAPVSHQQGAVLGRLFVLRDVTRETEAERQRSAFVATVSHELRAPLTVIQGYSETLLGDLQMGWWDPTAERELLEIVQSSADTLSRLVENLLDAATLEAGVLRLEREPIRLERLIEPLVSRRRALTPDHDLRLEVAPNLPLAAADPLRVEQVVTNLIDNAIKYSPDGGPVTVQIGKGPGDAELMVSVADRGVGLAAEQAARVFERFYRAGEPSGGSPRGVGLGLFLCKRLVEAQGGKIWVESTPGVGSTFRFTLPVLAEADDGTDQPAPAAVRVVEETPVPADLPAAPVGVGR
ncbi:MAG TPA: ATP-binding protein [Chloroflexota bacterium]|nr:ATP-binding protein [Chloroflexota bacterium]